MFFDRVKYTATQVSSVLFNVAVVPGFEELPTTATRAKLYLLDSAGNSAMIDGYRSGTQIHVNFIHESSTALNLMPTFGAGLEIYSTVGAPVLRQRRGRGAIVHIGQSNGMGTEDATVGPLDYTDSRILQWSGSNSGLILAEDPLEHAVAPDAGSVGMSMTFAKDLLAYEDHNQIVIIPHCEGSTGFYEGQWVQGGGLYNGALAKVNAFLAENPYNYIIAIVWSLGEDDSQSATRVATFEASLDLATNNFRSDIVGNVAMPNADRVPVLVTQMSPDWNINASVQVGKDILTDFPNRIQYGGYVDSTGAGTQTELFNIHFNTLGYRLMGSRMYAALQLARGNTDAGAPGSITGTANVTLEAVTSNASGSIPIAGISGSANVTMANFTASGSGSSNPAAPDVTGSANVTMAEFTSTASGNVVTAVTAEAIFNRGVGQTTGGTLTWANQGTLGSSHDAVQATAAEQPTFDASGNVVFDGSNDRLDLPIDLANDSSGISVMVRFRLNAGETGVFLGSSAGRSLAFYASSGKLTAFSGGSPVLSGATTLSSGTWYKAYYTVNASNAQEVWLNGVSDGTTAGSGSWTVPTFLNIGVYNDTSVPMDGDISDMIVHRGVLSLSDMNDLTAGW